MSAASDAELITAVKTAARGALGAVRDAHPGEDLSAFALCTDDDLRTIFHVAATTEFCERSEDPDIRFLPVDWTYDEGAEYLDGANSQLAARPEAAEDFTHHVEESFACLVEALHQLRREGVFPANVALIVTSTDPGPRLEELADAGVRRLNDAEIYRGWREVMGHES